MQSNSQGMLGRLNHVAIVVSDLDAAIETYEHTLGATTSTPQDLPEHGVTVVFVDLPNTRIELLHPLGNGSPVGKFLEKHKDGGIHHLCIEVTDIAQASKELTDKGARILGDGTAKIGAHGNPVIFLHPKDFHGCLIELEQV